MITVETDVSPTNLNNSRNIQNEQYNFRARSISPPVTSHLGKYMFSSEFK